ncbi:MAG: ATP-binding protein [Acidobacteriota bacterium]
MATRFRLKGERLLILALVTLFLFVSLVYVLLQKAEAFSPKYFTNTVLLSVLGFVNAILILALLYFLFRNLIRLVADRRRGILGSQFKTKLVGIFLGLTLIPSILLFVAAGKLIEHSIKKWFSTPVDEVVRASQDVVDSTYQRFRGEALHFARRVADDVASRRLLSSSHRRLLRDAMEERLQEYRLDLIVVSAGGEEPIMVVNPRLSLSVVAGLPNDIVERASSGRPADRIDEIGTGRIVRAAVPVPSTLARGSPAAVVSVGYEVPVRVADLTQRMARAAEDYRQTKALESPIQRSYYLVLILVTVLVVFSTVWVGLALARRITVPIQLLAEGTREISAGHLDYRVDIDADDEIGILVDSFNQMTRDLRTSTRELEERRRYIETLLENITPGVVSLDRTGRVTTINRSACGLLDIAGAGPVHALPVSDLLSRPRHEELRDLVTAALADAEPVLERRLSILSAGRTLTLSVTLTPLRDVDGASLGLIVVLEDVTRLLRAEKVAAWQDVARRLAHEIKNPLTPIQLSAQRIAKKFAEGSPDLGQAVEEGTEAIVEEVNALKRLVNEFSRFARLPSVNRRPVNPHHIIDQTIALYDGSHRGLTFVRDYGANGDLVQIDPEQMKRVCMNLFDNAIEAMQGSGTITVATRNLPRHQGFELEVRDEGPGVPEADRAHLFEPYFSTKAGGTGLGLAIVSRIIADHDGSVRCESQVPGGSRFIIELPAQA